jgi:hypothetical protein
MCAQRRAADRTEHQGKNMANINWNDGRLIALGAGDTATAAGALNARQLYGLFFYNVAGNDADTVVDVVWSNSQPPQQVVVPGTTARQGLASILFVSGNDTNTVSAAVRQGQPGAQPANGQMNSFSAFTRFYQVAQSHWYAAMLQSNINQFICVQFAEQRAKVYVVNKTSDPALHVQGVGSATSQFEITPSDHQTISWYLQGDGTQLVWINADSVQNSQSAAISLQSLSGLYEMQATAR